MRRAQRIVVAALAAWIVGSSLPAEAAEEEPRCDRPKISLLRYDEDYSFLKDARCRDDFWDPVKYLGLNDGLPLYLSLGLDVRERVELFRTVDWGRAPDQRVGFVLQRVMPYADLHVAQPFQLFGQLTSNLVWGNDPRPLDRDDLDLLQAFASASVGTFSVRVGRQEVQYANSRLVSIREGPNVRLAFDGVRLMQRFGGWQVDGFGLLPVQVKPGVFDDRAEPGQSFWGLYATGPVLKDALGLDVYYLGRHRADAAFEQGAGDELRHTFGARLWGKASGFDYNVEPAYQTGAFGEGSIAAWMVASDVGYSFSALPAAPRLGVQLNAVSGDRDPLDPDLQTFNPLFPRGAYFSQANLIGPLNLVDVHPALTLNPQSIEGLAVTLDWDFFWRQSLGDGLYQPSTLLQVPGAGNPNRYVGSQAAALVQWQATRNASLGATYSHFFTGPFFRHAGLTPDVEFVALWLSYSI